MKRDNAFTGLEAAIVLIAFVVVAAIFSYVMLGAGFFATQKAQEVTYAGVKQTTSNLIPDGTIYGSVTGDVVTKIQLALSVPVGGQPQEFKDLLITYSKEGKTPRNIVMANTAWLSPPANPTEKDRFTMASCTGDLNGETLIGPGNSCNIIILLDPGYGPRSGEWFQLEIKPPIGAPTTIRKTIATGFEGGKLL